MIRTYLTDSAWAFVVVIKKIDSTLVQVYDLDHMLVQVPGEPGIAGRYTAGYRLNSLLMHGPGELRIHEGMPDLVVPAECMVNVFEFLRDVANELDT